MKKNQNRVGGKSSPDTPAPQPQSETAILQLCEFAVRNATPDDQVTLAAVEALAPDQYLQAAAGNMEFAAARFIAAREHFVDRMAALRAAADRKEAA